MGLSKINFIGFTPFFSIFRPLGLEVVTVYLNKCNLFEDLAQDRLQWRNIIRIANPTQLGQGLCGGGRRH